MFKKYIKKAGFVFLEILIATTIITVVFTVLLGIGFSAINISSSIKKQTQADFLAKEELEALRSYRDGTTWASTGPPTGLGAVTFTDSNDINPYYYYLFVDTSASPPKWNMASGKETTGIYTRYVVFYKVSRDPTTNYIQNDYIESNRDFDTVKVKITVSWLDKISRVFAYLTNWQNK